jgi:hypothetical protein
MFSHYVPVQLDSNHVRARLDIQRVPIVLLQKIALGIFESVDAARRMRIGKAVVDLDFVADLRRGLFVVDRSDYGVLRARRVANGDAAVTAGADPIFDVEIELGEVVAFGV